jgi:amino acid transporter
VNHPVPLKRSVGFPGLLFLGVGTMVGAGFYALLGKVAGLAGQAAPLSLVAAAGLALLNGLAFAEFASRFPVSAGVARYVAEGLGTAWAPRLTGWLVIATGVVSAGTLSLATAGFLQDLLPVPQVPALIVVVAILGTIAAWGIGESVAFVGVITAIEVGALLAVFGLNLEFLGEWRPFSGSVGVPAQAVGLFSGAFLAFYAFIGFEDLVSVAEEARSPRRALPLAILLSLVITSIIYLLVCIVAVAGVGPERLAASRTPVAELVTRMGSAAPVAITVVSLLTGINGALVQIIMAARVSHGMAHQGDAPAWLGRVHERTRTPLLSTAAAAVVVLGLALFFPLAGLARATSAIILVVFALVNLSLWRLKGREDRPQEAALALPRWVPLAGFMSCVVVLAFELGLRMAGAQG